MISNQQVQVVKLTVTSYSRIKKNQRIKRLIFKYFSAAG